MKREWLDGFHSGWLSIDEIRAMEGLAPIGSEPDPEEDEDEQA